MGFDVKDVYCVLKEQQIMSAGPIHHSAEELLRPKISPRENAGLA